MNYEKVIKKIEDMLIEGMGDRKAIIGISGGIDSAVVAALCTRALGKERVLGVLMPYGEQSTEDSRLVVNTLGIESKEINIKPIVDEYNFLKLDKESKGNIMARNRMTILYAFSNTLEGVVVGTSNKSEIELGYFTKYGDGGVDVEPIGDVYKTEIFEIARRINIPQKIIDKAPSADLWDGQTDEGELGLTYKEIDSVLKGEIKEGKLYDAVQNWIKHSEHKRKMPPTFEVREE